MSVSKTPSHFSHLSVPLFTMMRTSVFAGRHLCRKQKVLTNSLPQATLVTSASASHSGTATTRTPSIRFRYGKRSNVPSKDFVQPSSRPATSPSSPSQSQQTSSNAAKAPTSIDPSSFFASDPSSWMRDNAKFLEAYSSLPAHLHPKPLPAKVLEMIELGGAEPYEAKPKGKGKA